MAYFVPACSGWAVGRDFRIRPAAPAPAAPAASASGGVRQRWRRRPPVLGLAGAGGRQECSEYVFREKRHRVTLKGSAIINFRHFLGFFLGPTWGPS